MKYLPLIVSALWRRPAETIFTLLAVTAGFILFVAMIGLDVTYQRAIDGVAEDRMIVGSRFPATQGGLLVGLEEQLQRIPGVVAVGAWASVCGRYGASERHTCVYTADDGMRSAFPFPIDTASWNLLMNTVDGVLISHKAAQNLDLHVGDVLPLVVGAGIRGDGSNSWPFKVIGIVPDSAEWSHGYRVGNLKYFRNNRPPDVQGQVGGFRLGLSDPGQANDIARRIDHLFANSGTPTKTFPAREDALNSYRSVVDMALLTRLVAAAGLFMILYLTANTIARAVRERTTELGILQAIGFTRTQLMGLVFVEAAAPCLLGAALGSWMAGMLASLPGRWLPAGISIPDSTVSPGVVLAALVAATMLALISSALPILTLWDKRPAELLAAA